MANLPAGGTGSATLARYYQPFSDVCAPTRDAGWPASATSTSPPTGDHFVIVATGFNPEAGD